MLQEMKDNIELLVKENSKRRTLTFAKELEEIKFFFKAEAPSEISNCCSTFSTGGELVEKNYENESVTYYNNNHYDNYKNNITNYYGFEEKQNITKSNDNLLSSVNKTITTVNELSTSNSLASLSYSQQIFQKCLQQKLQQKLQQEMELQPLQPQSNNSEKNTNKTRKMALAMLERGLSRRLRSEKSENTTTTELPLPRRISTTEIPLPRNISTTEIPPLSKIQPLSKNISTTEIPLPKRVLTTFNEDKTSTISLLPLPKTSTVLTCNKTITPLPINKNETSIVPPTDNNKIITTLPISKNETSIVSSTDSNKTITPIPINKNETSVVQPPTDNNKMSIVTSTESDKISKVSSIENNNKVPLHTLHALKSNAETSKIPRLKKEKISTFGKENNNTNTNIATTKEIKTQYNSSSENIGKVRVESTEKQRRKRRPRSQSFGSVNENIKNKLIIENQNKSFDNKSSSSSLSVTEELNRYTNVNTKTISTTNSNDLLKSLKHSSMAIPSPHSDLKSTNKSGVTNVSISELLTKSKITINHNNNPNNNNNSNNNKKYAKRTRSYSSPTSIQIYSYPLSCY